MKLLKNNASATVIFLITTLLCLVFYFLAGPAIIKEALSRDDPENLRFSFSFCGDELATESVLSATWLNDDTLQIKAMATPNCGASWLFGDYDLNENNIQLTYSSVMPSILACTCGYPVEYIISPINKGEYNIGLSAGKEIYSPPSIFNRLIGIEAVKP